MDQITSKLGYRSYAKSYPSYAGPNLGSFDRLQNEHLSGGEGCYSDAKVVGRMQWFPVMCQIPDITRARESAVLRDKDQERFSVVCP